MVKKLLKELFEGMTLIELMIVVAIIGILLALFFQQDKKAEFINYCISKGNNPEDCRWEWERLKSGQASDVIFIAR